MKDFESAVSLSMFSTEATSITDLATLLLGDFYFTYRNWQESWPRVGNKEIRESYLEACETVGTNVTFTRDGKKLVGRVLDVDQDGQLLVELLDGQTVGLNSDTALEVRDVRVGN